MGIVLSSISSIANYIFKELQSDDLKSSICNELYGVLNVQQSMIEQVYISPLKTFKDFINNNMYSEAIRSLMDLSNREATPKVNYILAMALLKNGNIELGKQKLETAISMNPYMECFEKYLQSNLQCSTPIIGWSSFPYTINDTFANKTLRRLGFKVNEGVLEVEICTSGGDILYLIKTEKGAKFGLLDISNGYTIWQKYEENVDTYNYKIVTCTPAYVVLKIGRNYYFYNRWSNCVSQYSENAFQLLFSKKSELEYVSKYLETKKIDEYSDLIKIPTLSNKITSVIPVRHQKHKYWKSDENQPHPGIDFDPVIYWAMNIEIKID